jgi:hypothetical protein
MFLCAPDDEFRMIGIIFDKNNKFRDVIDAYAFTTARPIHDFPYLWLSLLFGHLEDSHRRRLNYVLTWIFIPFPRALPG